jgi:hypothetical protein
VLLFEVEKSEGKKQRALKEQLKEHSRQRCNRNQIISHPMETLRESFKGELLTVSARVK